MQSSLTTQVISILKPYMPSIQSSTPLNVGSVLPDSVLQVWLLVDGQFNSRPSTKQALRRFLAEPNDPNLEAAFTLLLERAIQETPNFSRDLQSALSNNSSVQIPKDKIENPVVFIQKESNRIFVRTQAAEKINAFPPDSPMSMYLNYLLNQTRFVQFQGARIQNQPANFDLEYCFIPLRTTRQQSVTLAGYRLDSDSMPGPGKLPMLRTQNRQLTVTVAVTMEQILNANRHLVILGETGSGKTTLMRYLALLYGRDLATNSRKVQEMLHLSESGYLPVFMQLDFLAAALKQYYPSYSPKYAQNVLMDLIIKVLATQGVFVADTFFDSYLRAGKIIFLFNGLDQIGDMALREKIVGLIEDFAREFSRCRYILTCRQRDYTSKIQLGSSFSVTELNNFSLDDSRRLLSYWYQTYLFDEMGLNNFSDPVVEEWLRDFTDHLRENDRVLEMARNPLLLNLISLVYNRDTRVPATRVELYSRAMSIYLGGLQHRTGEESGATMLNEQEMMLVLQQIAVSMHENRYRTINLETLWRMLAERFAEILPNRRGVRQSVEQFLLTIRKYTGLLVSEYEGVYAFCHRSFQEYLCANAMASRSDYLVQTLSRLDSIWWSDSILLLAGVLSQQDKTRTNNLIQAITEYQQNGMPYEHLSIAAGCLVEAGSNRFIRSFVTKKLRSVLDKPQEKNTDPTIISPERLELIRLRSLAAQAMVRSGSGYWTEPYYEPEWVNIPAGEFMMGNDRGDVDERPANVLYLDSYWISRIPIANIQYAYFIQQTGHKAPGYWDGSFPPQGKESHPVVGVSWYDAMDYCRWLSEVTRKMITLPSEAEWEKAARGVENTPSMDIPDTPLWYRNTIELGLYDTTPVGIFPEGASPYGVLDMFGNIWEWTRSLWGRDAFAASYSYPYRPRDGREGTDAPNLIFRVLRGGSFFYSNKVARSTYRYRNFPEHGYYDLGFRVISKLARGTGTLA